MSGRVQLCRVACYYLGMADRRVREQPSLFTPGFGRRPHLVAGRSAEIADISESVFAAPHHPNSNNLILGQRGFGKTVMLNEIEDIAAAEGWVVIRVDASSPGLAQRIMVEAAKNPFVQDVMGATPAALDAAHTTKTVSSSLRLWLARFTKEITETKASASVRDTLEVLGHGALEHGTGVLLTVDEMHAGERDEMVRLSADLQLVTSRDDELPIAFVGAALPEVLHTMLTDRRLSFFRRCEQYEVSAVGEEDARFFFEQGIKDGGGEIAQDALEMLVLHAHGYPYKMQLLGHWAWRHANAPKKTIIAEDAEFADLQATSIVRKRVYEHVWQNLSQKERALVRAVSNHGGQAALWDVSDLLPYSPEAISDLLKRADAIGALTYDGGTHVRLGPLMDEEFVRGSTAALSIMEQHRDRTKQPSHDAPGSAVTSDTGGRTRRPRCNTPMKQVTGRCIRPEGHSGRCRSK